MNQLQDRPTAGQQPLTTQRIQPYTRTPNVLYDELKPGMYHKVDRSVLDVLVRLSEGFHRVDVALTIPDIALKAGVSRSSVTRALARLTDQGVIDRDKKKLTQAGRYIWVFRLTESYRVHQSHVTLTCQGAMAMKESLVQKALEDHHQGPTPPPIPPPPSTMMKAPEGVAGQPLELPDPPQSNPELPESPGVASPPKSCAKPGQEEVQTPKPTLPLANPGLAEKSSKPNSLPPAFAQGAALAAEGQKIPAAAAAPTPLTEEQRQLALQLARWGVNRFIARRLVQEEPLPVIQEALEGIGLRSNISRPAGWLYSEIKRGGYRPAEDSQQKRGQKAELEAKLERAEALRQDAQAQEINQSLQRFQKLPLEQQQALIQQAQKRLPNACRRDPQALRVDSAFMQAQLAELILELEHKDRLKVARPTPRRGGFSRRQPTNFEDFSRTAQDERPGRATNRHG